MALSTVGERVEAFIPPPLPPAPPVRMDRLNSLLDNANLALGRLDGMTSVLPDTDLFLYMYVRKEALLSSQIEGTQSSLSELLLFERAELPGVTLDDVQDVANYVAAMDHGLARIREGFPISLRLIRGIHEKLLSKGRGSKRQPGEFRRSQNWIGGSRPGNAVFVPPPPGQVPDLMSDLEKFIHADTPEIPALIEAGLVHVQFETIHPFLDGNGRLGRLLIAFLLCTQGILKEPILYLSLYLKTHRQTYYDLLQWVRDRGDWEAWLEFFLERHRRNIAAGRRYGPRTARPVRGGPAPDRAPRPAGNLGPPGPPAPATEPARCHRRRCARPAPVAAHSRQRGPAPGEPRHPPRNDRQTARSPVRL